MKAIIAAEVAAPSNMAAVTAAEMAAPSHVAAITAAKTTAEVAAPAVRLGVICGHSSHQHDERSSEDLFCIDFQHDVSPRKGLVWVAPWPPY
jgi:hypothetical protein